MKKWICRIFGCICDNGNIADFVCPRCGEHHKITWPMDIGVKIIINGKVFETSDRVVNYDKIIKMSGDPCRPDYSVICTPPEHKAFIVCQGQPDFELVEGMRFNVALTGAA